LNIFACSNKHPYDLRFFMPMKLQYTKFESLEHTKF
jgi:hypothetical protein